MGDRVEHLGEALARLRPRLHVPTAGPAAEPEPEPEPQPACPLCKDRGFVRRDVDITHPDFGRALPCSCRLGELRDRLRRRSNLGPLADRTFASFVPEGRDPAASDQARMRLKAAFEACRTYAEEPSGWLVLRGPSGCGKTHLAAAIANRRIELGCQAFFAVVPDLLDHLRASFSPGSDLTYDELFESVRNAELLVLDDLGAQSGSPWAQEKLFQLLNHRFNTELPTVITSNHRTSDLDERLRARLEDTSVSTIYEVRTWDAPVLESLLGSWPEGLQQRTFENWVAGYSQSLDLAHQEAWDFAQRPDGWLVLVGEVGCGKTHLAAAIKNERSRHGEATVFMTVPDLLDYLRATYAPTSDVTYDRGFDAIRNAAVLILDDYGAHSSTPWAEEKLFQLLNHRYNARLPTVITTNVPLDRPMTFGASQMQELRIYSRLVDKDLSRVVRIDAPPYKRPNLTGRQRSRSRQS